MMFSISQRDIGKLSVTVFSSSCTLNMLKVLEYANSCLKPPLKSGFSFLSLSLSLLELPNSTVFLYPFNCEQLEVRVCLLFLYPQCLTPFSASELLFKMSELLKTAYLEGNKAVYY